MPRTSTSHSPPPPTSTSTSQPRKQQRLSSLTSFLPKSFGSIPPSTTTTTRSSSSKQKKRKRRIVESDEDDQDQDVEIIDDDDDDDYLEEKKKPKSKESGSIQVIDLTGTDDEEEESEIEMPPPPKPKKKKNKLLTKKLEKGKGKLINSPPPSLVEVEEEDENVMWVDKFFPTCKEELAIHSKKLKDVSNWFSETFPSPSELGGPPNIISTKYRRILVLSGPSGSGKTTSLKLLAKEFKVEILEWKESSQVLNSNDDYDDESMVSKFQSFLTRAGMVPSLEFSNPDSEDDEEEDQVTPPTTPLASTSTSTSSSNQKKRLILLEDLPNVSHYETKQIFRSSLLQYLTSPRVNCPLVLIVSEALSRPGIDSLETITAGTGGGSGIGRGDENVDSRSVCGLQVLQHPACREIPFNPIAQTIMKKALNRILDQIYNNNSSSSSSFSTTTTLRSRPSTNVLDLIIQNSNGDIRSALMSLQFLLTQKQDENSSFVGVAGKVKSSKKKSRTSTTAGEGGEGFLQFVTSRENSLFIFHLLGKVLYNKRWGESLQDDKKDLNRPGILQQPKPQEQPDRLPKHLRKEWERKPSKVDPDVLFAEAPIDSEIFLTYLHHNFPQFTSKSIESCSSILDSLSISDSIYHLDSNDSSSSGGRRGNRSALTSLYSFDQAVRGTLLGLPSPVLREKQVLRKSEWWENEKFRKENFQGVNELLTPTTSNTSTLVGEGVGVGVGVGVGGWSGRGDKKSLLTELIPWLGIIKPPNVNPFLLDLAQFPPLSFDSSLTGTALGEKDIKLEEEEEEDDDDEDTAAGVDERKPPKKLEEIDVNEDEGVKGEEERLKNYSENGDNWYEEEDDIVDSD
ncbi:hypothetical protein JCM3765_004725 [Sporobolomyces pararoseus]